MIMLKVFSLRTEHLHNPIGIDAKTPRLSWKIASDGNDVMQEAYQVQASLHEKFFHLLWDSGKVKTDQSQGILYGGPKLESMERVFWRVKVWSNQQEESDWSEPAYFETGLLEASDWKAKWIEPEEEVDVDTYKPASYIRKEFVVKKGLVSARAYITAKGLYRFYINGIEGTDHLFTPGFTSYYKRLQYQAYDITSLLHEGHNALGIILGDGWWRGNVGAMNFKNNFGYKVAFLGQIVLNYEDGTQEFIGSDSTFKTSTGPILKSDLKAGEVYDARLEKVISGWNMPGFDDSSWKNVKETDDRLENLIATRSVPVRRKERFTPRVLVTPNGETVLDFGQNIAGWVEMEVEGEAGTEVVLVHGETLDRNGNFTLDNLREFAMKGDFQEVHYILSGNGVECYIPHFAFFGFRYVLLKNYPGEVKPEKFTAVAIYSDMEETGSFVCSHQLINQLVLNTKWSMKGNFLDIPTDCPTRERAGWTGDAQVFCKTATYLMNVYSFFEKWLADLAAEQYKNGCVGNTIPNVIGYHNKDEIERIIKTVPQEMIVFGPPNSGEPMIIEGSAGWGDAAVIIPRIMYLCYGDINILKNQYDSAKAWVEYMCKCANDANENYKDHPAYHNYTEGELEANYIWDTKFHWGEWLETDTGQGDIADSESFVINKMTFSEPLVATAYYAYSTRLLSEMAAVLGQQEEEEKYRNLYEKVKRVYNKHFINENGYVIDMRGKIVNRQAPYVRTLAFDLAYDDKKQAVADRLAELVKQNDYHLNTGFLSTPFILHVLADYGYSDVAFKLLEQTTFPSWLYAVTKGATTIWESWNGISPDGELFGSFNHYAYGAVCDFLFAGVAGICPVMEKPGYKHFLLKPLVGGTLTYASASYENPYGTIVSSWEKTEKGINCHFVVPANTTATIMLKSKQMDIGQLVNKFKGIRYEDGHIVFEVGSGEYNITIPSKA